VYPFGGRRAKKGRLMRPPKTQDFYKTPGISGVLYRLPWNVGLICLGYLYIGLGIAMKHGVVSVSQWLDGGFGNSYVAASMLLYSFVGSSILWCLMGIKKRDIAGLIVLVAFFFTLFEFECCFLHKLLGYIIWPVYPLSAV
jgi:hypothetical protein